MKHKPLGTYDIHGREAQKVLTVPRQLDRCKEFPTALTDSVEMELEIDEHGDPRLIITPSEF